MNYSFMFLWPDRGTPKNTTFKVPSNSAFAYFVPCLQAEQARTEKIEAAACAVQRMRIRQGQGLDRRPLLT